VSGDHEDYDDEGKRHDSQPKNYRALCCGHKNARIARLEAAIRKTWAMRYSSWYLQDALGQAAALLDPPPWEEKTK
jgi:hypothetical protein